MFTKAITSENAPKAIGPYSPAVKLGDFVYLSGQTPLDAETNELVEGGIQEQTYQVLKNLEAILAEMNLEMRHIVKTTVFMTDLADFDAMNEIYATYFAHPYPARSTVQVCALPKGAKIEIEAVVIDTLLYEQQLQAQQGGCGCGEEGCGDDSCGCGDDSCGCGDGELGCGDDSCGCNGTDTEETKTSEENTSCENGCCCG